MKTSRSAAGGTHASASTQRLASGCDPDYKKHVFRSLVFLCASLPLPSVLFQGSETAVISFLSGCAEKTGRELAASHMIRYTCATLPVFATVVRTWTFNVCVIFAGHKSTSVLTIIWIAAFCAAVVLSDSFPYYFDMERSLPRRIELAEVYTLPRSEDGLAAIDYHGHA